MKCIPVVSGSFDKQQIEPPCGRPQGMPGMAAPGAPKAPLPGAAEAENMAGAAPPPEGDFKRIYA